MSKSDTTKAKQEKLMSQLEVLAASKKPELNRDLSGDIMSLISSERDDTEMLSRQIHSGFKWLVGSLIMTNVALVAALLIVVSSQSVVKNGGQQAAQSSLGSWEGFQTIGIKVPQNQAHLLKTANSHVDILVQLREDKKLAVAKFLPVLGVKASDDKPSSLAMIYVLADDLTAKRIALAKEEHSIEVSPLIIPQPAIREVKPHMVSLRDPSGRMIAPEIAASSSAVLYLSDSETGRQVRHVLKDGFWTKDTSTDVYSF